MGTDTEAVRKRDTAVKALTEAQYSIAALREMIVDVDRQTGRKEKHIYVDFHQQEPVAPTIIASAQTIAAQVQR